MKFDSRDGFIAYLQSAPTPKNFKERTEFSVVRSWAFSPMFRTSMSSNGPFEISRGSEPPDFLIKSGVENIAIEVTAFTTGMLEIFSRQRPAPSLSTSANQAEQKAGKHVYRQPSGTGLFTSTLRSNEPDKQFWENLVNGKLPDDSWTALHFEAISDLDADYMSVAKKVLTGKVAALQNYRASYARCILLIHDKLSAFDDIIRRRQPAEAMLGALASTFSETFDEVICIDGNHFSSETATKLIQAKK